MSELSVVIPTLGRPATLRRVLDGLATQGVSAGSFEALVVCDAREPDPGAVREAAENRAYATRVERAERPGASAARNLGWRTAGAPLVLFLGDDVVPEPQLAAEHLAWHRREPAEEVGVLGHVRWARELRVTPFMRWLDRGVQFDFGGIEGTEAGWGRFYTANASVKRSLLQRAGGFDEERLPFLYEDLDLACRMSALGFRLLYNPRAAAEHLHPADLDSWGARAREVAAAEVEFCRLHPEVRPHFHELFSAALAAPAARGRGARLARLVPPGLPWLGPRVWAAADLWWRQQLAPGFMAAWEAAAQPEGAGSPSGPPEAARSASSGGASPSGPK